MTNSGATTNEERIFSADSIHSTLGGIFQVSGGGGARGSEDGGKNRFHMPDSQLVYIDVALVTSVEQHQFILAVELTLGLCLTVFSEGCSIQLIQLIFKSVASGPAVRLHLKNVHVIVSVCSYHNCTCKRDNCVHKVIWLSKIKLDT